MRFTASRAHRKLPVTLTANMRARRSAVIVSTRCERSTITGVVDERRDAAERLVGLGEDLQHVFFPGDIACNGILHSFQEKFL